MSWIKDYLSFSKRERTAFIVVIILIVGFIFLPNLFSPPRKPMLVPEQIRKELAEIDNSFKKEENNNDGNDNWQTQITPEEKREIRLFVFDPNTIDENGLITLGVPEKTARTIINYRNKGGRFRQPEDLGKIYSLKKEDADRIIPYARISASENYYSGYSNYKKDGYEKKPYIIKTIDINTATEEEWKSLPGIGDALSARIVKFREKLSGFASIDQVAKTYGLKDSTFQLIRPYLTMAVAAVNKININTAYENELLECAAISPDVAKAIIIYRKQHGNYQSIEEIKNIVFITEEMFRKIAPHLKVN